MLNPSQSPSLRRSQNSPRKCLLPFSSSPPSSLLHCYFSSSLLFYVCLFHHSHYFSFHIISPPHTHTHTVPPLSLLLISPPHTHCSTSLSPTYPPPPPTHTHTLYHLSPISLSQLLPSFPPSFFYLFLLSSNSKISPINTLHKSSTPWSPHDFPLSFAPPPFPSSLTFLLHGASSFLTLPVGRSGMILGTSVLVHLILALALTHSSSPSSSRIVIPSSTPLVLPLVLGLVVAL